MDELLNRISSELSEKRARHNLDISNKSGLCLWTNETSTGNKQILQFCHYGRENKLILPFVEVFLRTRRHTDHLSRIDRPNTRPPHTCLAARYN